MNNELVARHLKEVHDLEVTDEQARNICRLATTQTLEDGIRELMEQRRALSQSQFIQGHYHRFTEKGTAMVIWNKEQ